MMGTQRAPAQLFYNFDLKRYIPYGHMLREIDHFLDVDGMREALRLLEAHHALNRLRLCGPNGAKDEFLLATGWHMAAGNSRN